MKVLQRNVAAKVPAPQPLPQLANAPEAFRLGYESERLVLELGEGMPKEAGKWRAKLRGEGWEVIGITYPELSKKPWKLVRRLQTILARRAGASRRPPLTRKVFNEWRLQCFLTDLSNHGKLPFEGLDGA
jgi:hypothetical protein